MNGDPPGMCLCGHMHPCAHTPYAGMPTRRDEDYPTKVDMQRLRQIARYLQRVMTEDHRQQQATHQRWEAKKGQVA